VVGERVDVVGAAPDDGCPHTRPAPSAAAVAAFAAERASAGGAPAVLRVDTPHTNAETRTMAREHAKAATDAERAVAGAGSASVV
jgi:hypothetical protein